MIIAPSLIIVLYVLSTGPAVWLARHRYVSGPAWPNPSIVRYENPLSASRSRDVPLFSFVPMFDPGEFDYAMCPTGTIYKPLRRPYLSAPALLQRAFDTYVDWWRG